MSESGSWGYMADVTGVLKTYLGSRGMWWDPADREEFERGRLAMGLEILSVVKMLEGMVGSSLLAMAREEIISVLRTLLRGQGLEEDAEEWYGKLVEWRRVKFERVNDDVNDAPRGDRASEPDTLSGTDSPAQRTLGSPTLPRTKSPSDEPGA